MTATLAAGMFGKASNAAWTAAAVALYGMGAVVLPANVNVNVPPTTVEPTSPTKLTVCTELKLLPVAELGLKFVAPCC